MKIPALFRYLFCAFVAAALSVSASAQTAAGQIKAAKVQGEVLKITAAGATAPLKDGDALTESDTVTTGKGASVVLVFMNGSSVRVGSDSRLAVEEFKMDPLAQPLSNPTALKAEPSKSKTTLNLSYGEMVGDVKKLNSSSTYSIKTPVGAAGIRGTIYRIVFKPSSNGKAFFTISTAEGKVVMEGVTDQTIPVDEGKEVVVEIDTDNPTTPKIVTQDIPPATTALINAASRELTETMKDAVIDNPPPKNEPPPKKEEEAPALPQPANPNLTSKAGE
ncbi:MAG TPA: FecR family protein [Lacunisphaera sp.]